MPREKREREPLVLCYRDVGLVLRDCDGGFGGVFDFDVAVRPPYYVDGQVGEGYVDMASRKCRAVRRDSDTVAVHGGTPPERKPQHSRNNTAHGEYNGGHTENLLVCVNNFTYTQNCTTFQAATYTAAVPYYSA